MLPGALQNMEQLSGTSWDHKARNAQEGGMWKTIIGSQQAIEHTNLRY